MQRLKYKVSNKARWRAVSQASSGYSWYHTSGVLNLVRQLLL